MNSTISGILTYTWQAILATLSQLFILLGPLLLLAFIMHYVAKRNEYLSYKVLGNKVYLYGFGWLGTAIHELGHALFAIIFAHRITGMKLFSGNPDNSQLGYVNHSFNPRNIYQRIGNFFIGISPILLGSALLYLFSYLLFGFSHSQIQPYSFVGDDIFAFTNLKIAVVTTWNNIGSYLMFVFTSDKTSIIKIFIFTYLMFSIGSSISLSKADVENGLDGFLYFMLSLFVFNLLSLWIGDFMLKLATELLKLFSVFYFILLLSILINLLFTVALSILLKLKSPGSKK